MGRRVGTWLQLVEGLLVITVLLAFAWLAWRAVSEAYAPVFRILKGL